MYVLQVMPSRRKDSRKKKIMKELKELEAKLAKEKRKAEKYKKKVLEDETPSFRQTRLHGGILKSSLDEQEFVL